MEKISINTRDGKQDGYFFHPEGGGKFPLILFYMDAFGPRATLFEMAERISSQGYNVFLPDLYYRFGDYNSFDPKTAFNPGPERERLMGMIQSLSIASVMSDTSSILEYLERIPSVNISRTASLGYCMGGKFALAASSFFSDKVLAAASIHGGGLVTAQPDSPHSSAHLIKAKVYVGIATDDRSFTDQDKKQLEEAFSTAKVDATMEVYPGAYHGFAVEDMLAYNHKAAELHWERILQLFKETLLTSQSGDSSK